MSIAPNSKTVDTDKRSENDLRLCHKKTAQVFLGRLFVPYRSPNLLNCQLQLRRGFKPHRFAGLDLDRLASARVYAFARLGFAYRKCPKARQSKAASLLHFFDDGFNQVGRRTIGSDTSDFSRVLDNFSNKGL
jgi:hypothetical protein